MLNEWTDRLPGSEAEAIWQREIDAEVARRVAKIECELRRDIARDRAVPEGFYEAMRHFLTLRKKLFPAFPADPIWQILVTLAVTPEASGKASITGIAHGAEIPKTTALRCLAVMEEHGIVERVPHPSDGRQVLIRLTAEGRRRLDALAEQWALRLLIACALPAAILAAWFGAGAA